MPDAINNYRQSIELAKLKTGDTLDAEEQEELEDENEGQDDKNRGKPAKPIKKVAGMSEPFAFPLADGVAYLQVPENMTEQSYKMLLGYIQAAKPGLVRPKSDASAVENAKDAKATE